MTTEEAIERLKGTAGFLENLASRTEGENQDPDATAIRTVLDQLAAVTRERDRLIERWPDWITSDGDEGTVYEVRPGVWRVRYQDGEYPTKEAAVLAIIFSAVNDRPPETTLAIPNDFVRQVMESIGLGTREAGLTAMLMRLKRYAAAARAS